MRTRWTLTAVAVLLGGISTSAHTREAPRGSAQAQESPRVGMRLNNLKVLSDKVDDVTTPENILRAFVKPGLGDAGRSQAIWRGIVKYRHQEIPPNEFLAGDWEAHDPVKIFNTYGYCMCCCSSALFEALNRMDGRDARGRILNGHSVPEVAYGNGWHLFDASLINYFPKPDGTAASVDEIGQSIRDWYAANPGIEGDEAKLIDIMRRDTWMGWKEKGPALLAASPFYQSGYWPAGTHGWDSTMVEYARKPAEVYEYGYEIGHRALFSLRPGESLTREAGNRGLQVNGDPRWGALSESAKTSRDLRYVKDFLPGYAGGIVGNGIHRYAPDLRAGDLSAGADRYTGLAVGGAKGAPALHPRAAGMPGVAVFTMASPYIYLTGHIRVSAFRKSVADTVRVSLSTNNGRTFTPVWQDDALGVSDAVIDVTDRVLRRYAYQVKIEMSAAVPGNVGLNRLMVEDDIQHAPRTLPWLGKGANTITVASDSNPALATRSIACRITSDAHFSKNETTGTMGVRFDNLRVDDGSCWWTGGTGTMTVPLETLGDMVGLRFGAQIRARGEKDLIRMALSSDNGVTWREVGQIAGPTQGTTRYFRLESLPAGTRKALLRYELTGNNTVGILSFRVDIDYKDPLAAHAVRPFNVVHKWRENGLEKTKTQLVTQLPFHYSIPTVAEPEMVSVSYEMLSLGR